MKQTGSGVGGGWWGGWGLGSWRGAHTDGPGQREDWLMINLPWPQHRRSKHGPGRRATSNSGREQEEHGQIWRHSACSLDPVHIGFSSRWSDGKVDGAKAVWRVLRVGECVVTIEHTRQKDKARGSQHDNMSHWGFFLLLLCTVVKSFEAYQRRQSNNRDSFGQSVLFQVMEASKSASVKKMPLLSAPLLLIIIFKSLFLPFSLLVGIFI